MLEEKNEMLEEKAHLSFFFEWHLNRLKNIYIYKKRDKGGRGGVGNADIVRMGSLNTNLYYYSVILIAMFN